MNRERTSLVPMICVMALGLLIAGCFSNVTDYEMARSPEMRAQEGESFRQVKDALRGLLLPLLDDHDTEYAAGYDEDVFSALDIGASDQEVLKKLGQPFSIRNGIDARTFENNGHSLWDYSKHGEKSQSYFCRVLEFDARKRLVRKHATLYLD